jgi:hypothetical protein
MSQKGRGSTLGDQGVLLKVVIDIYIFMVAVGVHKKGYEVITGYITEEQTGAWLSLTFNLEEATSPCLKF